MRRHSQGKRIQKTQGFCIVTKNPECFKMPGGLCFMEFIRKVHIECLSLAWDKLMKIDHGQGYLVFNQVNKSTPYTILEILIASQELTVCYVRTYSILDLHWANLGAQYVFTKTLSSQWQSSLERALKCFRVFPMDVCSLIEGKKILFLGG